MTLNPSNIDTCAENGNALFSILATRFTTAETMPWIYWPELAMESGRKSGVRRPWTVMVYVINETILREIFFQLVKALFLFLLLIPSDAVNRLTYLKLEQLVKPFYHWKRTIWMRGNGFIEWIGYRTNMWDLNFFFVCEMKSSNMNVWNIWINELCHINLSSFCKMKSSSMNVWNIWINELNITLMLQPKRIIFHICTLICCQSNNRLA